MVSCSNVGRTVSPVASNVVGIVAEDVERAKAAADFVQVAGEHIGLKRVGRQWQGLCPFHAEKTPSFYLNPELKLYHCWGCDAKGDIITFVRELRQLDFAEAVEWLAGKFGVPLRYDDVKGGQDRQRKALLTEAMERAVEWYHLRLLQSPDAGRARSYLRDRGYDRAAVEQFRLGWAPGGDDWGEMCKALKLPRDVLEDTGLGFVNKGGRQQDSFRGRVLFPIFDSAGKPVAFGGRVLPGGDGPKYKNSSETKLYKKSSTLYALNWAKTEASSRGEVIVCEGYTDVIAFFRSGMPRAVATCGTALADEHFRTLKNFARRIVLAYDADSAGQSAAQRFYEWEQRYEVDIVVASLPPGSDPGELGRTDPEALRSAVDRARPFLEFRLDRLLAAADLTTAEGRARTAESALAAISEHPNELVRDQYVMRVADRCRLDPDRLRDRLRGGDQSGRPLAARPPSAQRRARRSGAEVEALRLAVHRPELVADRLEEVLFADEVNLAAFRALASAETLTDAIETARPEARDLLFALAVEEAESDADDVVCLLVAAAGRRELEALQREARQALSPTDYAATIAWLKVTLEQLWESGTSKGACTTLVAWLSRSAEEQGQLADEAATGTMYGETA